MAKSAKGPGAWEAGLRDRFDRLRTWFEKYVAFPLLGRVAPKADAKTKSVLTASLAALILVGAAGIVGGVVWLLTARDDRLVMVVAGISGDRDGTWHARVRNALHETLGGLVILRDSRAVLPAEDQIVDKRAANARNAAAQRIIQQLHGNVIVWGELSRSGRSAKLFFLPWDGTTNTSRAHRYALKEALHINTNPDPGIDMAIAVLAIRKSRSREDGGINLAPLLGPLESGLLKRIRAGLPNDERRGEMLRAYATALAMHARATGDRTIFKSAIDAYRKALVAISPVDSPFDWVSLRSDFADALDSVGIAEGPDYTRESLAIRQQVVSFYSEAQAPLDWAAAEIAYGGTQSDLAYALGDSGVEQAAIDIYNKALREFARAESPLDWADTESRIGSALRSLSYLTNDAGPLDPARAALKLALLERTVSRAPLDWADTESELGTVGRMEAEFKNDPAGYTEAIAADRAVLKVVARDEHPSQWATYQIELANVLGDRGKMTKNAKDFDDAIAAYKAALEIDTLAHSPSSHVVTLYDLGLTLRQYAKVAHDPAKLRDAIANLEEAVAIARKYGFTGDLRDSQNELDGAKADLAEMKAH